MSNKCTYFKCNKEAVETCDYCDDKWCIDHIFSGRDPNGEDTDICPDCVDFGCRM